MLRELNIRGFAIIDGLRLSLGPGLSCLTGETGAGKSILVDAISVVLGGRVDPEDLRPGSEPSVEAAFDISGLARLRARLNELGIEEDGELILRRAFSTSGRGRVYINSSLANLATLQEVGDHLVDIHGQHDHQSLLRPETHLDLLDQYCSLSTEREKYAGAYNRLADLKKRLDTLNAQSKERAGRLDLLRFQLAEIDGAAPVTGEEEGLAAERARLMHADRLKSLAVSALDALRDGEGSALMLLGEAMKAAKEIEAIVPGQDECGRLIESARVTAGEACSYLRVFGDTLEADPDRLTEVETRLDTLARLKKKYGGDIGEVLKYRAAAADELASLETGEEELSGLTGRIREEEASVANLAGVLTAARKGASGGFCGKVEGELAGLGMEKARFEVRFEALPAPGPSGAEKAEFLFSANPGEPPRPLARIASGGELSRVMLALRVVLASADMVPTLVFDEVDSGVGGTTAGAVGRKLREAAAGRQVLCVTHLPQIASLSEDHYVVEKKEEKGRVSVRVRKLGKDERVKEVARMLGGVEGSRTASAHAEELVRQGESNG